jgi:hypothetical protein
LTRTVLKPPAGTRDAHGMYRPSAPNWRMSYWTVWPQKKNATCNFPLSKTFSSHLQEPNKCTLRWVTAAAAQRWRPPNSNHSMNNMFVKP